MKILDWIRISKISDFFNTIGLVKLKLPTLHCTVIGLMRDRAIRRSWLTSVNVLANSI